MGSSTSIPLVQMDPLQLVEHLILCSTERGILMADGASEEELVNAQTKVETVQLEVMRRMAW
jgi:hypothetical protein